MSSEEQRQKEEAASRRHAKLDNAGVLHMSTQAEIPDKITIVSIPLLGFGGVAARRSATSYAHGKGTQK